MGSARRYFCFRFFYVGESEDFFSFVRNDEINDCNDAFEFFKLVGHSGNDYSLVVSEETLFEDHWNPPSRWWSIVAETYLCEKEKGDCACFSMRSISKEPNRPTIDKVLGVANGAIQLRIGAYKSYWLVTRTWNLEGVKRRWVMNAWRETLPINTSSSRVSYLLSARSDRWSFKLKLNHTRNRTSNHTLTR